MTISVHETRMKIPESLVHKPELNAIVAQRHDFGEGVWVIQAAPDGWSLPGFEAGQYATLGLPGTAPRWGGADPEPPLAHPQKLIKRAYSIASSPLERDHLEFYFVLVKDGVLSPRLYALQTGDRLWLSGRIMGSFVMSTAPPDVNLVFVATGTGIAPFVSMLRTSLRRETTRRFALFHGVRVSQDLGYKEELLALERVSRNLSYVPIVSRPQNELVPWTGRTGYVQEVWESGVLEKTWGFKPTPDNTHIFLCGSPEMVESMVTLLDREGFAERSRARPGQIHLERYW
jgi:ferredoxin--NADP+ reductase